MSPQTPHKPEERASWGIDRHIPIALILGMVIQVLVVGNWYGRTNQRLDNIETWIADNRQTEHRLTQVETKIDSVVTTINGIARKLDVRTP